MNAKALTVVLLILAVACLSAGCTSTTPPPEPVATTVPTTIETTIIPTTEVMSTPTASPLVPGPTETIPPVTAVSINVEKAGIYSTTIITHFDGGKGMSQVSRIDVRVTRPDGSVVTGIVKPEKGETLELEGTKGDDRVEVTVTMKSGVSYKVYDQLVPYKSRG